MQNKVVLLTGGSSGIGRETALALRDKGCTVYEGSRRDNDLPGIHHLTLDITDDNSVANAVETVLEREGKIDILVNCAGAGISGAVEFTETEAVKWQVDVNFLGTVRMTKAVLPAMRKAGGGRIVSISSVASVFPIPFQSYYSASKAAIDGWSLALANEVAPYGIHVTAIQPGDIRTGFTAAREKSAIGDDVYGGRIGRSVAVMEKDEQNGMDPAKAGRMIANIVLRQKCAPLVTLGASYKCLVFLKRLLPLSVVNKLIGTIYGK